MNRDELLMKLNTIIFPNFSNFVEKKGLAEVSRIFCILLTMGLHQQSEVLKRKADIMQQENKYRYELLYRLESIWRRLDLICIQIQSIDFDIIDGVSISDAMLERTYNHFYELKSNTEKVVGLLKKLGKSDQVESLCDQIDKAADDLEKVIKI